jgi:hypothetical protein
VRVTVFIIACGAAVSLACSPSNAGAPADTSIVGTWSLETVNGAPLPYVLTDSASTRTEVTADVLTFLPSGQFTQLTQLRTTTAGEANTQTVPQAGTFSSNRGSVTLQFTGDSASYSGTVSGRTFTLAYQALTLRYGKE